MSIHARLHDGAVPSEAIPAGGPAVGVSQLPPVFPAYIAAAPSVEQADEDVTQITSQARRAVDPHRDDERAFPAWVVQMIMWGSNGARSPTKLWCLRRV